MEKQIGWYNLKEDRVYRNTFEFAAWYEDVRVKAGKYPVTVYDYRVGKHDDERYNNQIHGHIDAAYVDMDGVIESDYFAAHFFGVPVSDYDTHKNAGKESAYRMMYRLYEIADEMVNDPDSPWELLPGYEADTYRFEYNGETHTMSAIYWRGE